jgi:hypothetical protein
MRSVRTFVLLTLVSATSVWACSDTKPVQTAADAGAGGITGTGGAGGAGGVITDGGATGTGGATSTGGTTGTGGTTAGADAGTPPGSGCTIPCLVTLTQDCVPSGTCMEQSGGITADNRCYSNGVKVGTMLAVLPTPSLTLTTKKPDGGVCYTVTGALTSVQATTAALVLKNAAGQQVATGSYNLTTMQASVMCDGATFDAAAVASCAGVLSLPSLPGTTTAGPGSCTAGTCAP